MEYNLNDLKRTPCLYFAFFYLISYCVKDQHVVHKLFFWLIFEDASHDTSQEGEEEECKCGKLGSVFTTTIHLWIIMRDNELVFITRNEIEWIIW